MRPTIPSKLVVQITQDHRLFIRNLTWHQYRSHISIYQVQMLVNPRRRGCSHTLLTTDNSIPQRIPLIRRYPTSTQLKLHNSDFTADPADIHIPSHQVVVHNHISSLMIPCLILHITSIHHMIFTNRNVY